MHGDDLRIFKLTLRPCLREASLAGLPLNVHRGACVSNHLLCRGLQLLLLLLVYVLKNRKVIYLAVLFV